MFSVHESVHVLYRKFLVRATKGQASLREASPQGVLAPPLQPPSPRGCAPRTPPTHLLPLHTCAYFCSEARNCPLCITNDTRTLCAALVRQTARQHTHLKHYGTCMRMHAMRA